MNVGIRDLRANLSRHLREVQAGTELVVTDRGQAIARIVPSGERTLEALIREGVVTPATETRRSLPSHRIAASGTVSDLIDRDRG